VLWQQKTLSSLFMTKIWEARLVGRYQCEERITGFRKLLSIPEQVIPFAVVPIGHPEEQKPPRSDRY